MNIVKENWIWGTVGMGILVLIFVLFISPGFITDSSDGDSAQANDNGDETASVGETATQSDPAEASTPNTNDEAEIRQIIEEVIDDKLGEDGFNIVSQDDLDAAVSVILLEIDTKLGELGNNLFTKDDILQIVTEAINTKIVQGMISNDSPTSNGENAGSLNISALMQDWDPSDPSDDLNSMPKTVIELANEDVWFHRVFNERLFHEPDWGGADSWFVSLNLGPQSGGFWTDHGKFSSGRIVYRGENTSLSWCIGVLTTSQYKDEFLDKEGDYDVAINVRIAPFNDVMVFTHSEESFTQATSDMGDITIILPDDGVTIICTAYTTAAPTHESHLWWGSYDRSEFINTIDAR